LNDTRSDFDGLWSLYLWIGVGVAVLIFVVVGFVLVRYRAREGREPSQEDEHNLLEIAAAVLISAIVAFLVFHTFRTEAKEDATPEVRTHIDVTAFQWGWRFAYPGKGVTEVGGSNRWPTLFVPVDRPIGFALSSIDVIHAFWIPDERFKRDAIPGKVNNFVLEFRKPGYEEGLCSEFCGLRHQNMRFNIRILPGKGYDRWLAAQR
jgi:cytochrome c oxidase subunit 2